MRGKAKSFSKKPKPKKEEESKIFMYIDKITDKFSFKHLDKVIDKNDTVAIIFLIIVVFIFTKIWDFTINQTGVLFGLPYWFIIALLFVVILLFALFIYRRKFN